MSKCCTVKCPRQAGDRALRWDDYPDEPVCDPCADFYTALQSTTFDVIRTHKPRPSDGAFQVVTR